MGKNYFIFFKTSGNRVHKNCPVYLFLDITKIVKIFECFSYGTFSVCASTSLVGAYYLHPPDAGAIFLLDDLLCNGTCSVTGGHITYWGGGTNGKDSLYDNRENK